MSGIKVTNENFADLLIESVDESVRHAKGKITLSSERLSLPPKPPKYSKTKIKRLRKTMNVSQSVFADLLNVSVKTVQAWEQGDNTPKGTTTRLLQIVENNPEYFIGSILKGESA